MKMSDWTDNHRGVRPRAYPVFDHRFVERTKFESGEQELIVTVLSEAVDRVVSFDWTKRAATSDEALERVELTRWFASYVPPGYDAPAVTIELASAAAHVDVDDVRAWAKSRGVPIANVR